jgi:hypothetical protein
VTSETELTGYLPRLALGFIAACIAAVGFYGVLRLVQIRLFPEANPATVIWSAHAGYYWRCWTVAYAGAMVGFLAFGAAKRSPEKVARALVRGLTVAVAVVTYQGLMVP